MTVLINGMDMPESCDNCGLCACYVREDGTEENYRCAVTMYPIHDFDKRHKNCPLVPVPSHGRLIDADEFEKHIKNDWEGYDQWIAVEVENRPTVIPAEGET